ncbi:hypothetical protein JBKA6_0862 [Ichthyobacterium seriolicida]|uniref:DUF192 domain-containing protein n=1 Tax=Ichthyobacterium seriolicida TaxID=242600 RepID=A0A1J1EAB6_9FLAO|nr:hypothetical protein JBKA6_0862 [Ichthyobacterium seriolicida]
MIIGTQLYKALSHEKVSKYKKAEVPFKKEGELSIFVQDREIKLDIEIANTDIERAQGLMYRSEMLENRGMLFIFEVDQVHSFWMKNTRIPLDILYINKDKEVINIVENARPKNTKNIPSSDGPCLYVLEINGGLSSKWNIKKGTKIDWIEKE